MREIGSLSSQDHAVRLVSYLQSQHIPSSSDPEDDHWVIWVENDDDREAARDILRQFEANPDAPEYKDAVEAARKVRQQQLAKENAIRNRQIDIRQRWNGGWWQRYPVTQIMTGLCILVVLVCTDWQSGKRGSFGLPATCNDRDSRLLNLLWMEEPITVTVMGYVMQLPVEPHLKETLAKGEVWRLVTPIFIHLDVLHILFNMMWLRNMGIAIEFVRGSRRFILLVLILAVVSNLTQYFWAGPRFGGMSGVVFGLIGYVWMKGKTQPRLGLGLMPDQVVYSIAWLLLCMTGAFGAIANAAHLGGFLAGILIGARQRLFAYITGNS